MTEIETETDNKDGTTTVTKQCIFCNQPASITLDTAKWRAWDYGRGPFIQDLMPEMSAGERETLISGSHEACFDKAFPPEDEDGFTFIGLDA